jgi:hypothetical protein
MLKDRRKNVREKEKTGKKNERQKFRKKERKKGRKKGRDIVGSLGHTSVTTRVCSQTDIPATMLCTVINGLTAPRLRCKAHRFQHSEQPQDNGQTQDNATLPTALRSTYRRPFI